MFKIIDSEDAISYDEARTDYKGFMILMLKDTERTDFGKVYAISDRLDVSKISDLQIELYDKNIKTHQVNSLTGGVGTLTVRRCELL